MLKGQVFANQLFENQIFALFINTFTNGANGVSDNYKNGMEVTYSGSNVTIDSGAVLIQGRLLEEDTSTTISAGADNMFCKLVIEIDLDKTNTSLEFNQGYYKILKSSTTYPTLTQTNIVKNNAGIYQYELARFKTTANGITDFQDMRTFIDFTNIYEMIEDHIEELENQSNLVFKTGSTMTGKLIAQGGIEGNVEGNVQGNVTGNVNGNSATASKLATGRRIILTGAVTGNGTFTGEYDVSIATSPTTNLWEKTVTSTSVSVDLQFRRIGNVVVVRVKANYLTTSRQKYIDITLSDLPSWAKRTIYSTTQATRIAEYNQMGDQTTYDETICNLRLQVDGNIHFTFSQHTTEGSASGSGVPAFEMLYLVY